MRTRTAKKQAKKFTVVFKLQLFHLFTIDACLNNKIKNEIKFQKKNSINMGTLMYVETCGVHIVDNVTTVNHVPLIFELCLIYC